MGWGVARGPRVQVDLPEGLNPNSSSFFPASGCWFPALFPLSFFLFSFFLCLCRDPPVSPGKLSTHTAPVTLLLPPPSLSGVLSDQRPSQLFHFWVLGARDPFLEFLTTGGTDPTLASTGLQKWGLFPVLSGSRPVVSRPGLTPP